MAVFMVSQFNSLMHERDAADYLCVSIAWLQRARCYGAGPRFIKVGGPNGRAVRYRKSDLDTYLDQNTVETADSRHDCAKITDRPGRGH